MSTSLRILWLKTGPLHPLDTGGKLRTYHMLRELATKHQITYLSLCPSDTPEDAKTNAKEYSSRQIWIPWEGARKGGLRFFFELARNAVVGLPYVIQRYQSNEMTDAIFEEDRKGRHDLIVCDFLTPSINLYPFDCRKPHTPTLLFEHNVEAQIWQRLAENAGNFIKSLYFKSQWHRLAHFERNRAKRFKAVVGVSDEDCALLKKQYGLGNVLGSVPTGVDVAHFAHLGDTPQPGNIAFLGSMDWMPNTDAVMWFEAEIFPRIKKQVPDAVFTIIGRNPPLKVQELAQKNRSIKVTGTVADVRPFMGQAQIMVVPLRVGGGTRIKIYEAMAAGMPVVSTSIGAEGLKASHGLNILLADSPAEFAAEIIALLQDSDKRRSLGEAGRQFVSASFGWPQVTNVFEAYCRQTIEKKK